MNSDEQASLWAARCEASEMTEADHATLQAWLEENPTHASLLDEYRRLSSVLHQELPALVAAGSAALPPAPAPAHPRRVGWLLTACTAAAALAFSIWISRPAEQSESIATASGQRRTVVLADGSQVELSAHTSLQVSVGRKEREVRLAEGEAFFAVAKDHGRPFIVDTPAGSVRVTGTKFDVRAEPNAEFDVTVMEGSVQVRSGAVKNGAPVLLKAGDRFSSGHPADVQKLSEAGLRNALAWREGQIVFEGGVPMDKALAQFAHYHGIEIRVAPDVAALSVGGSHNLDDLEGFLASLSFSFPVRVLHDPSGSIRVVRRP